MITDLRLWFRRWWAAWWPLPYAVMARLQAKAIERAMLRPNRQRYERGNVALVLGQRRGQVKPTGRNGL